MAGTYVLQLTALDSVTGLSASSDITITVVVTTPLSWTIGPSTSPGVWTSIVWAATAPNGLGGQGLFVAVSNNRTPPGQNVMTSPDGITWTTRATPVAQQYHAVVWSAELRLFVAVANSGDAADAVMTSPDGITWTSRLAPTTDISGNPQNPSATPHWYGLTWADSAPNGSGGTGLFVVVGQSSAGQVVMTSSDGIIWTLHSTSGVPVNSWDAVTWSPQLGLFVAVAYSGTASNEVMTSPDGINWTARTAGDTNGWFSIVWAPTAPNGYGGQGIFVAVANALGGNGGPTATGNAVMTSPDGINWTSHSAPASQYGWWGVTWSPELGIFVAVGQHDLEGNEIITSLDGVIWTGNPSPMTYTPAHYWWNLAWSPQLGIFVVIADLSDSRILTSNLLSPAITSVSAVPTQTGAAITWTTNISSGSQVYYGTTTSYGDSTTLDSTLTFNHSVTLSGLACNTIYHYQVSSTYAGQSTLSADSTFTTSMPSAITGVANVCVGATTALTDTATGGTWSSSNTKLATVDSVTGIVTGISAGTSIITYTLPAGCITTTPVVVNPLPSAIGGAANICVGLTTVLTDTTTGGAWSSSNTTLAIIDVSGNVTGIAAGTPIFTYTISTGCITSIPVTVNPLPSAITGATNMCIGLTTALTDAGGGGWSSTTAIATVTGAGIVTGIAAGTTTITYSLATGCTDTIIVTVNPLPQAITGNKGICIGLTTTFSDGTMGGAWSSSDTTIASIDSVAGIVSGIAVGTTTMTYTIPTGCIMTTLFTVYPLPSAITGIPVVCPGMTTSFSDSAIGGAWSSGNTVIATIDATSGLVTGVTGGASEITYTLPTTCAISADVTVNPAPAVYTVNGGGGYCYGDTGVLVGLSGSDTGFNYQLYLVGSPIDTLAGTDTSLDFGLHTLAGTYTIISTNNATGCTNNMAANAVVSINALPLGHSVMGGGSYCKGGTGVAIGLDGSDTGITYKLYNGVTMVESLEGTDSAIKYGLETIAGIYKVVATNATTGCINMMSDSAVVTNIPIVTPFISFYTKDYDTVCGGLLASFTATTVNGGTIPVYQWSVNGTAVGFDVPAYSYVPLNGDVVVAVLISNASCLSTVLASNEVTMVVDTVYIPSVSILGNPGTIINKGQPDTLKAIVINGGPVPTYQWYKNGNANAGDTSSVYISDSFANKDSITCIVNGSGECGLPTFNSIIMQVNSLDITKITQSGIDITVAPNPSSGTFTIKGSLGTTNDEEVSLEITNMLGQVIYTNKVMTLEGIINEKVQINKAIASGMYILNVRSGVASNVFHIVVEQ